MKCDYLIVLGFKRAIWTFRILNNTPDQSDSNLTFEYTPDHSTNDLTAPVTKYDVIKTTNKLHHHHHHQSLNREGRWGTTDDFAISFLHFSLFSTALLDLANSWPDHSLTLSSHLFLCLPCLLPPFTVPCKMVFPRSDNQETWPYHCSLRLFTMVRRSSCDPIACWILARPSSLWVCLQKAAEHTPINDPTIQQPDDQHSISVSCATKDSKYLGSLVLSRTGN